MTSASPITANPSSSAYNSTPSFFILSPPMPRNRLLGHRAFRAATTRAACSSPEASPASTMMVGSGPDWSESDT